jgi:hypothetical protein
MNWKGLNYWANPGAHALRGLGGVPRAHRTIRGREAMNPVLVFERVCAFSSQIPEPLEGQSNTIIQPYQSR